MARKRPRRSSARQPKAHERKPKPGKPPLLWTGVLFAFAANVFLVTVIDLLISRLQVGLNFELLATVAAPLTVGVLTTLYVGLRGGMHAFIGGMASIPVLALWVFADRWPLALFAGAFCGLGGALAEKALTRRNAPRA